jgi:transposase
MIQLRQSDQFKMDIIHKVLKKQLSVKRAQQALNSSERTIYRLLKRYRESGPCVLIHRNRGKAPANKRTALKEKCLQLLKSEYSFLNRTHAREKLLEKHGLETKKTTFNRWCNEERILLKKIKRTSSKSRRMRERMKSTGVMLQMDGSYHPWIPGHLCCCLIVILDDANSDILWAEFVGHETTVDCMRGLKEVVQDNGIFNILYTDKAGVFGGKRGGFSQINRALNELGSTVVYAHSPEAKGRIERLFQTLQDRLCSEMKLEDIQTIEHANKYLKQIFIPTVWRKRFVLPGEYLSAFRPFDGKLVEVFCIKEIRKVARDNLIKFNNGVYQLPEILGNCRGGYVEIRSYLDGSWKAFYNESEIQDLKQMREDRKAS